MKKSEWKARLIAALEDAKYWKHWWEASQKNFQHMRSLKNKYHRIFWRFYWKAK